MVSKIPESDVPGARRALLWLSCSFSPLSPKELAEAAIFEEGSGTIESDVRLTDPLDILEICGSLVTYDDVSDEVRLAHRSVRDYLSQHVSKESPFYMPEEVAHEEVGRMCLEYLMLEHFDTGWCEGEELNRRLADYPLLSYAAGYWPAHVAKPTIELSLQSPILRIMDPSRNHHFLFWLQLVMSRSFGFAYAGSISKDWNPEPLYYAASYGLTQTVTSLVQLGARLDDRAGRFGGTALHAACFRRHPEVVRVLLDAGADHTIEDINYATPLDLCAWMDDKDIMKIFEEKGKLADHASSSKFLSLHPVRGWWQCHLCLTAHGEQSHRSCRLCYHEKCSECNEIPPKSPKSQQMGPIALSGRKPPTGCLSRCCQLKLYPKSPEADVNSMPKASHYVWPGTSYLQELLKIES